MGQNFQALNVLILEGTGQCKRLLLAALAILDITHIACASGAREALAHLRSEKCDVLFCDEACAGLNPVALTRMVRRDAQSRNRKIPVIFVLAKVRHRQVELLRDCGANDVLLMPLSADSVRRKLRSVLRSPKDFIEGRNFAGPDRRRRPAQDFIGKERRGGSGARTQRADP